MKCLVSFSYTSPTGNGFANLVAVLDTSTLYAPGVQMIQRQIEQHMADDPDEFRNGAAAVILNIVPVK